MISASKSILSLNNLNILRPKVTKNVTNPNPATVRFNDDLEAIL